MVSSQTTGYGRQRSGFVNLIQDTESEVFLHTSIGHLKRIKFHLLVHNYLCQICVRLHCLLFLFLVLLILSGALLTEWCCCHRWPKFSTYDERRPVRWLFVLIWNSGPPFLEFEALMAVQLVSQSYNFEVDLLCLDIIV